MDYFKRFTILELIIGLVVVFTTTTSGQPVILTANVTVSVPVCPRRTIKFICETRGSPTIAWRSNEYIGTGGASLQFGAFQNPGVTKTSDINSETVATLVDKRDEDGLEILVSELRIIPLQEYPSFSVTCVHANTSSETKTVRLLDDPEVPQSLVARQRSDESGRCTFLLSWNTPVNIAPEEVTTYRVFINGSNTWNETNDIDDNVTLTAYPVCDCVSTYTVSIAAVNRCGRVGPSTPEMIVENNNTKLLPPRVCVDDFTTEPSDSCPPIDDKVDKGFREATITIGVLFPFITILAVVVCIIIIIIRFTKCCSTCI